MSWDFKLEDDDNGRLPHSYFLILQINCGAPTQTIDNEISMVAWQTNTLQQDYVSVKVPINIGPFRFVLVSVWLMLTQ